MEHAHARHNDTATTSRWSFDTRITVGDLLHLLAVFIAAVVLYGKLAVIDDHVATMWAKFLAGGFLK